ncbi:hypothetical protein Dsin_019003 [Dipteronia sinensis]|uniref:MULE transposase domain-containing protein n=1 Tax=Dipteronia sinensis TaxID=43782 RepID=A0AAE0E236_9ROSI|nr:hypothetical protein Dsin_019003 [Dipteronia sinensis]
MLRIPSSTDKPLSLTVNGLTETVDFENQRKSKQLFSINRSPTGIGHSFFPSSIQWVAYPSHFKSHHPHCPPESTALQTHRPLNWNLIGDGNIDRTVPTSPSIELDSAATFFNRAYTVKFEMDHSQWSKDTMSWLLVQCANPIQSACKVSSVKPTNNLRSPSGTPNYKSVTGSINPLGSQASPRFTSASNDQATPASTTMHVVVDDNDSSESIDTLGRSDSSKTSDTEDESGDDDVSGSELYLIKAVRSVDVFEKSSDQGPIYKGQMFKDKPTLKRAIWSSKEHASNQVFGNPWESFQRLPAYFYVLEQSNPGTMTKIKTDSKNQFKYGFTAIGAYIEGFNSIIRPVICFDATHLKARTKGVLLVTLCKDGNEMIYPLAFGSTNSECTELWTWFLKKLCKLIQYPDRVMLVLDQHNAHGICAYHLAQNLKRFCKQRDDMIWLYYRATYAYRIEEFDRAMAELKETYRKFYDELLGAGVERFSRVHSPRKRYFLMTTNIAESMNSCLLAVRKLSITAMAEFIRDLLQRWFYNHRTNARECLHT